MELTVEGELVSQPYVRMTLAVMRAFGVDVPEGNLQQFNIPQTHYQGRVYSIEPDASAASYFLAAAAITNGEVTVEGLCARVYKATSHLSTAFNKWAVL